MKKRTKKQNRRKTLSGYIIRRYIRITITLFLAISVLDIIYGVLTAQEINDLLENLNAPTLVQSDYEAIDTSVLEDTHGWLEILDEDNRVIYTKGTPQEQRERYTQNELYEIMSVYNIWDGEVRGLNNIISITLRINPADYIATATEFTDTTGNVRTALVKIPTESVHTTLTFSAFNGSSFRGVYLLAYASGGSALLLFIFLLWRYARSVRMHLQEPNKKLVDSLEVVTKGNYDEKLALDAEYEYQDIETSFNFMVQDLKEARRKNEVYEQERQQLFSSIAHDLRTPVTSIRGCAQAIAEGVVTDKHKQQEYLQTIQRKSERISELMELLMVYTKLNHNEFELKKERLDFCEYIMNMMAENYNEIEKHGMELAPEIPEEALYATIDRVEFGRVVTNLLTNAMRHNPEGTTIRVKVFTKEEHLILEVWDNGTRIPDDMARTIFEPFVLGDESRTSKSGSGLGLSVCKKSSTAMRGPLNCGWPATGNIFILNYKNIRSTRTCVS